MTRGAQVFIWKTAFADGNEVAPLLSELSETEQAHAVRLTRDRRHVEFVCGRYLLRKVFSERFQANLPDRLHADGEKPRAKNFLPFNLSHSKKFVSFVVSEGSEVGLDIETEDEKRDVVKIAETYADDREIALLKSLNPAAQSSTFYKIWSLKESFAKATGEGLDLSLKNLKFNFDESVIVETPKGQDCVMFHSKKADLHISVSVMSKDAATPTVWEVEQTPNGFEYKKLEDVHFEKFVVVVPSVPTHH